MNGGLKPIRWIGTSLRDLRSFPRAVRIDIGHALFIAQEGGIDPAAKPLKGFGGASVLEIVAAHHGNAWRAVYTVRLEDAIYVLHGGFNGSTQHQFEIYLQDFEGLNSLATVDSKETKPCLGLIEYRPGQRFFVKELWAQSIKEGVASTV